MSVEVLSFDELLARLGFTDDDPRGQAEHISICHQGSGVAFSSEVRVWSAAAGTAARLTENSQRNIWHSVHALSEVAKGRGTADDVVRLTSLVPDLDVKEGGCGDLTTAELIIDDLSAVLGELPVGAVYSGHGIQPYWSVECQSGRALMADGKAEAKRLLDRFKALVFSIAARYGCGADSVYDLARVMRTPGSVNWKDPENPVPVRCFAYDGKPMTAEQIHAALDAAGIPEDPEKKRAKKQPRGEKKPKDDTPPRYAVSAAMTPGKPNPKVRARLAEALTDVAIETDRHHKTRDHTMALLRFGYNGESGVAEALEALYRVFVVTVGPDRMGGEQEAAGEFASFVAGAEELLAAEPPHPRFEWPGPTPTFGSSRTNDCREDDTGWQADDDQRAGEADFWLQRPVLVRIHQFARFRRANPYAVLGSVLRRAITLVEPRVQLPPTVGATASLNLFTVNVGRSGQGKDSANGVGRDAVVFTNADGAALDDPDSPGIGSGEGLARVFKGYGGQDQPPRCVHVEINEVGTLTALADRKGHTLVGELLKAFMGQAIGFTNSQKSTTTFVHAHTYRLCLGIGAQPENADFFLDREKDGLPQRFLWLPIVNRYALPPSDDEEAVPAAEVALPTFSTLVEGAPYLIGVPASVRAAIRNFHFLVEIGSPDVDPLDGHLMLVRLKVAFGLALLEGRGDISEDDWRIAGQLIDMSNRVRADMRRVVADRHRRTNTARAYDRADREAIIAEKLSEKTQQRVVNAITRKLSRVGAATRRNLQRACDSLIARDFPAVFDLMVDQGLLVAEGGEGDATRYRLASS